MKQLREHIKKTISRLAEEKYQAPAEIVDALKMDLMLNPLIRYVKELKIVTPKIEIVVIKSKFFL